MKLKYVSIYYKKIFKKVKQVFFIFNYKFAKILYVRE